MKQENLFDFDHTEKGVKSDMLDVYLDIVLFKQE